MAQRKTVQDLKKEQEKLEQELKIKQQNLKALKKQSAELERRERTHRLCTHGAMLEQYLNPDEYTDDQISYILREIFNDPSFREFLREIREQNASTTEIP